MSSAVEEYRDERAHALRTRYHDVFGGPDLPVPVEDLPSAIGGTFA